MYKKIAVEEHWTNEHFLQLRLDWIARSNITMTLSKEELERIATLVQDMEIRVCEMDRLGIAQQILISGSNGTEGIEDPGRAVEECQRFNDACLEAMQRYPDRFRAFAVLPYQSPADAVRELERCMAKGAFVGARLSGYVQGHFMDEPQFWPIFQRGEELGAYFYLHPTETPEFAAGLYQGCETLLGSSWSWGVDTATYLLRLVLSGVFDAYPKLSVILGHMGEMLPYAMWRLEHRLQTMPREAAASYGVRKWSQQSQTASEEAGGTRSITELLRKHVYLSTSGNLSESALQCAIREFGEDRIMFSVDYPYEDMGQAVDFLESAALTGSQKEKIFYRNAKKIFGL